MKGHVATLADKTIKDTQGMFDNHLRPLHLLRLNEISREDVEAIRLPFAKRQPRTANRIRLTIRGVYKFANKNNANVLDPTATISQEPVTSRERFIQADEMPRFYAALEQAPQPHRDLFRLMLLTGARMGNMLAARFDQFDLEHAIWSVPGSQHKNKKPHAMALSPEAVAIVRRRLAAAKGSPFLWPSATTKSGHLPNVRHEWAALLKRAGITGLWRHDVRRTVGAWLSIGGANMQTVAKQLGHSTIHATAVYARLNADATRPAMAGMLKAMDKAGKSKSKR